MKRKKALLNCIVIALVFSLASGTAWAEDGSSSFNWIKGPYSFLKEKLTSLKDSIFSSSEKSSPLKETLTPSKENIASLKEHISLDNRIVYRYRSSGSDSDNDLYEYWNLRGKNYYSGKLDFYFSGRLKKDLDGSSQSVDDDPFASVEDLDGSWQDQIYQLYANWKDPERRFGLRLGRQYIDDVGWLHIDGGLLDIWERKKIRGKVFLGKPVSYYTSASDDWTGGFSLMTRPGKQNKVRLNYVMYRDDQAGETDEQASLDVWQRLGNRTRAHGKLSILDDKLQMIGGNVSHVAQDGLYDVYLRAKYYGDQDEETREYSPLSSVLGKRTAFTLLSARGSYAVESWLRVSPGMAFRLTNGGDRKNRNRQYANFDITLNITPHEYWDASVSGHYWKVSQDNRSLGLTGEVNYHRSKDWSVTAGTAYLDYIYSTKTADYETEVSPDVYTLYARLKYKISDSVSFRVNMEIEDNSYESENSVRFKSTLRTRF